MTKRALITGAQGQDGAYLAKLLLDQGYEVFGGMRRSSNDSDWRLRELEILGKIALVPFDLLDLPNILRMIAEIRPDELYNLAAQSFVGISFEQALLTSDIDGMGAARVLEALRTTNRECRFYQASTSEMFGRTAESPQKETTRLYPCSPYAAAKAYAHHMTINYREAHGLFACSGILFNHESPLRGQEFVTRKITLGFARLCHGGPPIEVGNLDARRDWGFAGDYVRAMWMMLQQEKASDYVVASGETHSVRDFIEVAGSVAGFEVAWEGEGGSSIGRDRKNGRVLVRVNPAFFRPTDVDILIGDPTRARKELGWKPNLRFQALCEMMMEADMRRLSKQSA